MYPGIELRLLRYVVAVAEELHFSRAAEKLHVAQPSLSKQIRDLEEELGIRLFDRTKREVHLTQAGSAFVIEAKEALLHSQRAVHAAKSSMQSNRFILGHSPNVNLSLLSKIRAFSASQFPQMLLSLTSAFTVELLQLVRSGEVDAGVVMLPAANEGLSIEPVLREPLLAALPSNHKVSQSRTLRLRDLTDLPLVFIPKRLHPQFHEHVHAICHREGYQPKIVQEVTTFAEAIPMVAEGLGVTFTRECDERFKSPGVVFRNIEGQPLAIESAVAFRTTSSSSFVQAMIFALQSKKRPTSVVAIRHRAAV
jgi:DNA-binding transcriptional LysR family regulator